MLEKVLEVENCSDVNKGSHTMVDVLKVDNHSIEINGLKVKNGSNGLVQKWKIVQSQKMIILNQV